LVWQDDVPDIVEIGRLRDAQTTVMICSVPLTRMPYFVFLFVKTRFCAVHDQSTEQKESHSQGGSADRIAPDEAYMADAAAKHAALLQQQAVAAAPGSPRGVAHALAAGGGDLGGGAPVSDSSRRAAAYAAAIEAAAAGRTADRRSIIVGRTTAGTLVLMAAPAVEFGPLGPLAHSTLAALAAFDEPLFRARLGELFPLLVALISADHAPVGGVMHVLDVPG
jgi:hypothetical protein